MTASPMLDLGQSFTRSLRAQRRSPNTLDVYARAVSAFDQFAEQHGIPRDVVAITRDHVERYLDHELSTHSPATAAVRHAGLRAFLSWCRDEGEITASPIERVKAPTVPETMPIVLTDTQVEAIVEACAGATFLDRRDHALLLLMSDTGIRRAEAAGMSLADIDQDRCSAVVRGKGDRVRSVPFSDRTCAAIDRYLRARSRHPHASSSALWVGPNGALSADAIAAVVSRRSTAAGVTRPDGRPIHPHLLRHHMADRALRQGVSEGDLMHVGGWRSAAVMRSYGRGNRDDRAHQAMRRTFL